jgi:phosphate transport system protein
MLQERLHELKGLCVEFTTLVIHMTDGSISGLIERDEQRLRTVIEEDEPRANAFEIDIEERCTNLMAQFHPLAKDLRTILMIYNMSGSLERMGDHAVNIAQSSRELIMQPPIKKFIDIPRMNELVRGMLSDVVSSLIHEDYDLALKICQRDDTIDGLRDQITRELITHMTENPSRITGCIHILRIAENLERIADLTTNISEDIIFISQGKVIKHHILDGTDTPPTV